MTKREILEILENEYGIDIKGLNKKTLVELESLLEECKRNSNDVDTEHTESELVTSNILAEGEVVEDIEVTNKVYENEVKLQLGVFDTVVRRFQPARDVKLKNLGAGDLYVDITNNNLIDKKNLIRPNETKEVNSVDILYMTSASRPIVQINYSN